MTTHTDQPPQAGNQAWQRFLTLVQEHFETVCWSDPDGKPKLVSLVDITSGAALTLVPLDALDTDTCAVLVAGSDGSLSARGPLVGPAAANDLAIRLAQAPGEHAGAACPVLLHPPDQPHISPEAWVDVPPPIAGHLWATPPGGAPTVLVLLDRATARMAVIGPFQAATDAQHWWPQPPTDHRVDRLVVALT